jgi:predicted dienelactone hydrolase
MGAVYIFRNILILFLLVALLFSCQKESPKDDNDSPTSETPFLYKTEDTFTANQIAQFLIHPEHRSGPNPIGSSEFSNLPLTVWVPKGAPEPFPVVIYSHGGGSRTIPGKSGEEWAKFLAKSGYAVIAMHHMSRSPEDVIANICGELGINPRGCDRNIYVPYYESTDRPQDAIAVMDSLEVIGWKTGFNFDLEKIVILGFSGGTNTTHYLAGGKRNAIFGVSQDTAYYSVEENRPKAFLAMSSGAGIQGGWTPQSLSDINKPFLCATGAADLSAELRAEFYDQLKSNHQYRLFINSQSAQHVAFNHELTGNNQERSDQLIFHQWLEAVNIAFLDYYVKEKKSALDWLKSNNLTEIIHEEIDENSTFPTWSYR